MRFIFWQNILSIHQAPLIRELADRFYVSIIAEKEISESRRSAGWQAPNMGNAEVILAPDDTQINKIINNNLSAIHIFTGINAFPMVYRAFLLASRCKCHIMVHMEPYENTDWKSLFRKLHYKLLKYKYQRYISAILATGKYGTKCYSKIGFSPDKIFEWGYFTEKMSVKAGEKVDSNVNLLFIGQLIKRKAILPLITVFLNDEKCNEATLTIIGDGGLREQVEQIIEGRLNIRYLGMLPNEKVSYYISQSDLLILPSYHDGWGAVVNEALTCGTRVLCSSACGASCLIDGHERGSVFSWKHPESLNQHLARWISSGPISLETRKKIALWAENHISAKIAANYLTAIVNYTKNINKVDKPQIPWI